VATFPDKGIAMVERDSAVSEQVGPGEGSPARTPSQRARRDEIIRVAMQLLEQRDYDRIQIREVAEAAGVALGTLYRYFPSKEQLYAHVLVSWSESFDTRVRAEASRTATDADRLRAVLRRAVRANVRYPNYVRLVAVLEVAQDPVVTRLFSEYGTQFSAALGATLQDVDEKDAAAITMMATLALGGLLSGWSRGIMPIERVYEHLDDVVNLIFTGPTSGRASSPRGPRAARTAKFAP
jgi:TetR/AcrR family transcriptional regulator, cholesterol catabolism regulator